MDGMEQHLSNKVKNYPIKDFKFEEESDMLELDTNKQVEVSVEKI